MEAFLSYFKWFFSASMYKIAAAALCRKSFDLMRLTQITDYFAGLVLKQIRQLFPLVLRFTLSTFFWWVGTSRSITMLYVSNSWLTTTQ